MYAATPSTCFAQRCHGPTGRGGLQVVVDYRSWWTTGRGGLQVAVVLPCNCAAHQETIRAAPSRIGVFDASALAVGGPLGDDEDGVLFLKQQLLPIN